MNKENDIINKLLASFPKFQTYLKEALDYLNGERLTTVELGVFSDFLYIFFKNSDSNNLKLGFKIINDILVTSNSDTQNIVATGFFESFQNKVINDNLDLSCFEVYLEPESKKIWNDLIDFWDGN